MAWAEDLDALTSRIAGPLFTRPEPRATFADLVRGLLADVPRKNSWQLADHMGHKNAYRFEWLLNGAKWDADLLRDEIRAYVVAHLGESDGVLIADDTQAIKKGDKSVGVAPQHCGATGQIENCQVLPMLTYASSLGHAFVNRRLYLPKGWTDDPVRLKTAGVPEKVTFETKPQQVIAMLAEELKAGTPFGWFTADSGYGRDPALRAYCHDQRLAYVMAIPVDLPLVGSRGQATRADKAASLLKPEVFERRSCGDGTKGGRFYDWAAVAVTVKDQPPAGGMTHTLLIRRSTSDPGDVELFLCHAPASTPVPKLIAVAGMRWKIEENNEHGKDLLGLNEYQVRKWTPWHRHVTTCMLAAAFLAVTHAHQGKAPTTSVGAICNHPA
ncbi:IS701 family transposase [Amycolatopsis sp.]|uniref:IS701 family transposase n=1 Tax=Amycolatopsis sp. TaxID=37632 RepID=UPI002D8067B1|nr:IS701 family transposase [Amycolatopsis sp.]HET6704321.1 IS701 family transposase [Amycolatopsis sp.]